MSGFFTAESTGRATENIDEILRDNMNETHKNIPTIGPAPEAQYMSGYPGQELGILNPLEWMSGIGAAGKINKLFFTGGSKMPDKVKNLRELWQRWKSWNTGMDFQTFKKGLKKDYPKTVSEYKAANKSSREALEAEKIFDKHGIPHNPITEADKALRQDPISFLLAKIKESRETF